MMIFWTLRVCVGGMWQNQFNFSLAIYRSLSITHDSNCDIYNMDVLSLQFKRGLGQRRGVYLISTHHYASAFGYYKIGMAEKNFNERFSRFKYAGYGAVDRIMCFGLICVSPIPPEASGAGRKDSPTENRAVTRIAHWIEQEILQRLAPFRLRYVDTGRRSEWIHVDLAVGLGVLGDYHDRIYRSNGHMQFISAQCFGVSIRSATGTQGQRQQRRGVVKEQERE